MQNQLAVLIKAASEEPMNRSCVRTTLGLFVLEFIQFAQDIDWDPNVVVCEPVNRVWIVQQYIGIKNVVLDVCPAAIE